MASNTGKKGSRSSSQGGNQQSNKGSGSQQSGSGSGSRSGGSAGTRGGTPEQHAEAGRQSHKNDKNR